MFFCLFQKFINIAEEYRVLVLGGRGQVVHTKVPRTYQELKVDYKNKNEHEKYFNLNEVDPEFIVQAEKAAQALNLNIAGVDVCREKETNKIWIIEVNRGPGLSSATTSPELPALAKYLESLVN